MVCVCFVRVCVGVYLCVLCHYLRMRVLFVTCCAVLHGVRVVCAVCVCVLLYGLSSALCLWFVLCLCACVRLG